MDIVREVFPKPGYVFQYLYKGRGGLPFSPSSCSLVMHLVFRTHV